MPKRKSTSSQASAVSFQAIRPSFFLDEEKVLQQFLTNGNPNVPTDLIEILHQFENTISNKRRKEKEMQGKQTIF